MLTVTGLIYVIVQIKVAYLKPMVKLENKRNNLFLQIFPLEVKLI